MKSKIAAIVLAAGASTRLGEPKQLLTFEGSTFIENSISSALQARCSPVIVVVGANRDRIVPAIIQSPIQIVINENWSEGMGSSIAKGICHLGSLEDVEAAIVMVCDQPYVSSALLRSLIDTSETSGSSIVASQYDGTVGVPVLFSRIHFQALSQLKGKEGAKQIIHSSKEHLSIVHFQKGAFDIDTEDDYKTLSGI